MQFVTIDDKTIHILLSQKLFNGRWALVKAIHKTHCAISQKPIHPGDEVWRPVTQGKFCHQRVHKHVMSGRAALMDESYWPDPPRPYGIPKPPKGPRGRPRKYPKKEPKEPEAKKKTPKPKAPKPPGRPRKRPLKPMSPEEVRLHKEAHEQMMSDLKKKVE
jgi:hypothetical protein